MAGVGRKSDFGKPEFSDSDMENRMDTVDPYLTYEENVEKLVKCGLKKDEAEKCVSRALISNSKDKERRMGILREETEYRKELGEIKECKKEDESCLAPEPEDKKE
jgi:hypothetical protein